MIWQTDEDGTRSFRVWRFQFISRPILQYFSTPQIHFWRLRKNYTLDVYIKNRLYISRFHFGEGEEDVKRFKNGA